MASAKASPLPKWNIPQPENFNALLLDESTTTPQLGVLMMTAPLRYRAFAAV
jgi:hypothetical protein